MTKLVIPIIRKLAFYQKYKKKSLKFAVIKIRNAHSSEKFLLL